MQVLHIAGRLQSGLQRAAYSVGMCSEEQTNKMFLAVARLVCTQRSLSCGGISIYSCAMVPCGQVRVPFSPNSLIQGLLSVLDVVLLCAEHFQLQTGRLGCWREYAQTVSK